MAWYLLVKNFLKRHLVGGAPYCWGILFICIPLLVVMKISFSQTMDTLPPYESLVEVESFYFLKIKIYIKHYIDLLKNDFYLYVLLSSLKLAFLSTIFALLFGYCMAFGIRSAPLIWRSVLLLLVIMPFFTSFLMRVYAWVNLLSTYGLINNFLMKVHLINTPIQFLGTIYAVCIGTVYCYLPFMVLPIYVALEKIDYSLIEAAYDLGAGPFQVFFRIIFPLSLPGVLAGCALVFIPIMGEFVIPELLGGANVLTLGRAIFWEFFSNHNWPMTCTMAILTIILLVLPTVLFQNYQRAKE